MKRFVFVVNPKAGRGKALKAWATIEPLLRHKGINYTLVRMNGNQPNFTTDSDTVLVAVGGDGTASTVGGWAFQQSCVFGVIPAGTGNDFAKNAGVPLDPLKALQTVLGGVERNVDVMDIDGRIGLNIFGFGIDSEVVRYAESRRWLKAIGRLSYAFVVPVVLARHKPFHVRLVIDGEDRRFEGVSLVAIANGPAFGGGMKVAPDAQMDDGRLDVCIVSGLRKLQLLWLFPRIYSGRHVTHPSVHILRGAHVAVFHASDLHHGESDGEQMPLRAQTTVKVVPGGLRTLVPSALERRATESTADISTKYGPS